MIIKEFKKSTASTNVQKPTGKKHPAPMYPATGNYMGILFRSGEKQEVMLFNTKKEIAKEPLIKRPQPTNDYTLAKLYWSDNYYTAEQAPEIAELVLMLYQYMGIWWDVSRLPDMDNADMLIEMRKGVMSLPKEDRDLSKIPELKLPSGIITHFDEKVLE